MEPATTLILTLGAAVIGIAAFSIYTAFGPPSKELRDPYEEHED
ncbi:MAG: photosystem II reaction center protein PsbN [Cyanosarcina radialis HA8281-LM2]|jgi:PsbN protein|nr:photosystem II reaction center protein PsbN [Cyanosarcina radialis HA8281-LM2]